MWPLLASIRMTLYHRNVLLAQTLVMDFSLFLFRGLKWRDRLEAALREKRAGVQAEPVVSQDSQNNGHIELKDVSSISEVLAFSVSLLIYYQWKTMHHTRRCF